MLDERRETARAAVAEAVRALGSDPLLQALGAPTPELVGPAADDERLGLMALHLGAMHLRIGVLCDLLTFYSSEAVGEGSPPAWSQDLNRAVNGGLARDNASLAYRWANRLMPGSAEAIYGQARIAFDRGESTRALEGFRTVTSMVPHSRTPPHAHLIANAWWQAATLFEDAGRTEEALDAYRNAVVRLDLFGVHHIRFARFLRRLGLLEEASDHYLRCTRYSHRYFPEFVLPPIEETTPSAAAAELDLIHETAAGDVVVFHQGAYWAIPPRLWPLDRASLEQQLADMASSPPKAPFAARSMPRWLKSIAQGLGLDARGSVPTIRRAMSIAELEAAAE